MQNESNNSSLVSPDLLAQIRALHLSTRKLVDRGFAGQYRSAFRGQGIEFEEVREYKPGDDIRAINWPVTARARKPHVKVYREERELTVVVAVDVSRSTLSGTRKQLRERVLAQVGAVLSLVAVNNNDKVGLVTFSDQVEKYIPPRRARSVVWRILHDVLSPRGHRPATDIGKVCEFLSQVLPRKAVVFILSDFFDSGFSQPLSVLSRRHDVTAIIVRDPIDFAPFNEGLGLLFDPESGSRHLVDFSNRKVREKYAEQVKQSRVSLTRTLVQSRAAFLELSTEEDFMPTLQAYFSGRHQRLLTKHERLGSDIERDVNNG